jgi:hypothetical protein
MSSPFSDGEVLRPMLDEVSQVAEIPGPIFA